MLFLDFAGDCRRRAYFEAFSAANAVFGDFIAQQFAAFSCRAALVIYMRQVFVFKVFERGKKGIGRALPQGAEGEFLGHLR